MNENSTFRYLVSRKHDEKITTLLNRADDEFYHMSRARRGICVIINQREFDIHTQLNDRRESDVDAGNLEKVFKVCFWDSSESIQ